MKLVVFDSNEEHARQNKIFDPKYGNPPFRSALIELYRQALKHDIQIITTDIYLEMEKDYSTCLLLSEMVTPQTKLLLEQHHLIPSICFCGESPNVAWSFYHNIEQYARNFKHLFVFRGAGTKLKSFTQIHPFYWPNARRDIIDGPQWYNRNYLVMIASNKYRFMVSSHKPLYNLRLFAKHIYWNYLKLINPLFRFDDLYQKRLDAIYYFSNMPDFRLYGSGWNKTGRMSKYLKAAKRAGAIPVDDKLAAMSNFKFALCFENCVFPGYVTEKIFDGFFAGCIPVYWGAPDITDFVPAETFVDVRQFDSWSDLDRYLRKMSESEARHYHANIRDFLASDAFDRFHQDSFVANIITILEEEFTNES
jgi:hypothetical protein